MSVALADGIVTDVHQLQSAQVPATFSVYEFGAFRLDSAERLLLRAGQPVSLTPKAFDLLVYLVERPGRLVTKQDLLSGIWRETFVEETNLTYTVSALRKALGDGQNGETLIQTVPTRGYRFVAPVTRQGNPSVSSTSETAAGSIPALVRRIGIVALAVGVVATLAILVRRSPKTTDSLATLHHSSARFRCRYGLGSRDADSGGADLARWQTRGACRAIVRRGACRLRASGSAA